MNTFSTAPSSAPANATNGISLPQVAESSQPDVFTLAGDYLTGGTPFQYHLNATARRRRMAWQTPIRAWSAIRAATGTTDYRMALWTDGSS